MARKIQIARGATVLVRSSTLRAWLADVDRDTEVGKDATLIEYPDEATPQDVEDLLVELRRRGEAEVTVIGEES